MNKLIVTIFGATGDLTLRKLLPALTRIIETQTDYTSMSVIAVGRRPYQTADYLNFVQTSKAFSGDLTKLAPHLVYAEVDALDGKSYDTLRRISDELTKGYDSVRALYYLAVGPDLFVPVATNLKDNGFISPGAENQIIAFEKPFGHTYEDAKAINEFLENTFDPRQIYRVDHYLGKEMIQKVLGLRFGNEMINAMWNKDHIREVKIVVTEVDGILNRGAYYDEVGVLNDMIQSHLLQMLALMIMDAPASLKSADIQTAKIAALQEVEYLPSASLLGQYIGYKEEKGVDPNSPIATLAFLTFKVKNSRFEGVPFYLYTGKKLAKKEAYIEVLFKTPKTSYLFTNNLQNRLRIDIAPFSRIMLYLNSREETHANSLSEISLEHCYNCEFPSAVKEAYEILFSEMIAGRKVLFPSWAEIDTSWQIIRQIRDKKPRAIKYPAGFSFTGENDNEEVWCYNAY